MTDSFDSRAIAYVDAYGQRFMREGTYRYHVVPAMCGAMTDDRPYFIEVVGDDDETMVQHTVLVKHHGRQFELEQPTLKIKTGDLVTWACRQPGAPAFEVVGDKPFFGSARLTNESGYAHAFAAAGEYEWVDAHGSGIGGIVRVRDPKIRSADDMAAWRAQLANGVLVMISGDTVDPAEVDVVTGQTVYFAVTSAAGISITDRRLADTAEAVQRATHGGVIAH